MKTVAVLAAKPGMVLGEDVVAGGRLIATAGSGVTEDLLRKLKSFNVAVISVKDAQETGTTHYQKIQADPYFIRFSQVYGQCLNKTKQLIDKVLISHEAPNYKEFMIIFIQLSQCVSSPAMLLDYLYNNSTNPEDGIYVHCLNSALISGIFADWVGLDKDQKRTAVMCGYFYDTGKFSLPVELIFKPGRLTPDEFDQIKKHTVLGYRKLKDLGFPQEICDAALSHHERYDSTGYPSKLPGRSIPYFAKFLSVVDAYDAMSTVRAYRNPLHVFQIIENLSADGFSKYDYSILMPVLIQLANIQVGRIVRLSDGENYEITHINQQCLHRPIVQKAQGKDILNLQLYPTLQIETFV